MKLNSSNKVDTNQYELEIELSAQEFEDAVEKAYRKAVKNITIPGFRKGKAPRKMIERVYGEEVFYEDAINAVYPEAYTKAVEEAGIEPVDAADVEVVKIGKEGFVFKAKVTVMPEVTVENYKGIKATKHVREVTDEMVNAELDKMRERGGRLVTVEGRAAERGDVATIDFEGFLDGTAFEGGKGEKFPLELGSGQFIPGFEDQVVGHQVGESFDIDVTFPEDYQAEELKGKAVVFKVTLHELQKKELPALDDEFAKDISEFDTLDELKADIKSKLQERLDTLAQENLENELVDAVIAGMTVELPQCMIERQIDEDVREFDMRLQQQGLKLDDYLKYTGSDREAFRKGFEEGATKKVKIRLALDKIVELEKLEATEEEIAAEFQKMADTYKMKVEEIKKFISEKDVARGLVNNKAIDLVRSSAEVTEEKAAEAK